VPTRTQASDHDTAALVWAVWPVKYRWSAAIGLLVVAVAFGAYCTVNFHHIFYGVVAGVVLIVGSASFLLPSTYTIDGDGIRRRGLLSSSRRSWDEVACFLCGDGFIAVSTEAEPDYNSVSRGMILRLDGNRDEIVQRLLQHIPEWRKPDDEDDDGEAS